MFYAVATGWAHGSRTVMAVPTVAATLAGLAAHRMVLGINSLLMLMIVRHSDTQEVAGLGSAVLFGSATGVGSVLATVVLPLAVRPVGPVRHRERLTVDCRADPARGGRSAACR